MLLTDTVFYLQTDKTCIEIETVGRHDVKMNREDTVFYLQTDKRKMGLEVGRMLR